MIETRIREMAAERRERIERLKLFDANLWLGRAQGFPLAREMDAAGLQAAMEERGIAGGLVSHWSGKTASPQQGNALLLAAGLERLGRPLRVIVTGLPLVTCEGGPLPGRAEAPVGRDGLPLPGCGEVAESAGNGNGPGLLAGVRLFPKTHGFVLAEWCVGSLCRWMAERRLPLFMWHTEIEWEAVHRLAKAFGDLAIVIESQPRKIIYQLRPLMALLRDCPNVHVEISNLTGPAFEMLLEDFGATRLIYGSFLPANDPLVPAGMILDAAISDDDRALIAGGNLRGMIEGPCQDREFRPAGSRSHTEPGMDARGGES